MSIFTDYTDASKEVIGRMGHDPAAENAFERIASRIELIRERHGRLFVAAVGGMLDSAAYLVSELERHADVRGVSVGHAHPATLSSLNNDKGGWDNAYREFLKTQDFGAEDMLLVFSVGGGQPGISNVVSNAVLYAKEQGAFIAAVVGKKNGVAQKNADVLIVVPAEEVVPGQVSALTQDAVRVIASALTHRLKITERTFDSPRSAPPDSLRIA